jgi:hypothetical protein
MARRLLDAFCVALFTAFLIGYGYVFWQTQQPDPNPYRNAEQQEPSQRKEDPYKVTRDWLYSAESAGYFTAWLAFLTAGLFGVAAMQLMMFRRQLRQMAEDTRLARATSKREAISRHEEFIAAHRPKLTIRFIDLSTQSNEPLTVTFVLANSGQTRAIIKNSLVDLQFHTDLPTPNYSDGQDVIGRIDLEPAAFMEGVFVKQMIAQTAITGRSMQETLNFGASLYFVGVIQYTDANGTWRRMCFCRKYNRSTERFDPVSDPDYEYED